MALCALAFIEQNSTNQLMQTEGRGFSPAEKAREERGFSP
jgi:hypothetical protein